jgi:hypothetical protein
MEDHRPDPDPLYARDFHAWTQQQAKRLRARSHDDIDWETVAEEIESLGRSDKREIGKRTGELLLHLLKWEHLPEKRKPGWLHTIREQRRQVRGLIRESPSLRDYPAQAIADEYAFARLKAPTRRAFPTGAFPKRADTAWTRFCPRISFQASHGIGKPCPLTEFHR